MNDPICDCCEGTQILTPADVTNRPGLAALVYRVGTHARFLETMKARLASMTVEIPNPDAAALSTRTYPLHGLTTRTADDPAIALLDGWATVADVLTFYQERIANEGFLRTAIERRSVLELARLVGYALRPGVASTVYLAYTIDENQKTPVELPIGTRSQSLPGPGELPQSFETSDVLDARAAWNTLKPRLSQPQTRCSILASKTKTLYLKGVTANLKPNDPLLIVRDGDPVFARVIDVQLDTINDRTAIILPTDLKACDPPAQPEYAGQLRALAERYGDVENFNVDPDGKMAQSVIGVLDDLRASATDTAPLAELAALVRAKHLAQINNELATASDANYTRLQSWLGALAGDLEATAANMEAALAEAEARPVRATQLTAESGSGGTDELLKVMEGLSIPRSVPTANTLQLPRKVQDSFAPNADSGLQVVNAGHSEFKGVLATALSNVQVTATNPLEVYALHLKTGVYGSTAPLKPITDRQGKVIGLQEWPLNGTLNVGVDLNRWNVGHPTDATISVTRGRLANTQRVELSPTKKTPVTLNRVEFTFDKLPTQTTGVPSSVVPYKVEYRDTGGGFTVSLTYTSKTDNTVDVAISVNGRTAETINIAPDQTAGAAIQSHNWKIAYFMDRFENEVLSVTGEAPLPSSPWDVIALDGTYDQIAPDSWYVIARPDRVQKIGQVADAQAVAKTDYSFPAKVTQLTLDKDWLTNGDLLLSDIRSTTVYAQSAKLELAEEPIEAPICGDDKEIELDGLYSDLKSGRWLIVAGDRSDIKDQRENVVNDLEAAELVMLGGVRHGLRLGGQPELPGDKTHTFITLANTPEGKKLAYCYQRDKVTIYGNVVKATHGETRNELLGNGDGSRAFQTFDLRQPPVTYVAAPNPSGVDSTLHVYVNDVEWHEADTLAGLARTDHKFITRTDDADKTSVIFGNGRQGGRLPTGAANVRAVYRNGIGNPGNVQAEQINLLVSRPLGVKAVINPLRASGGANRESGNQARKNVPLAVAALDRLVSVQDYADFARTFAGIAKATARRMSVGQRQIVHVTIAGADDIPIDPSSDLYRNLVKALRDYGDPDLPVQVDTREMLLLVISATVYLQPDYVWDQVVTNVRTKLLDTFSFDRRELGQDAVLSEAIAVMQAVPGVAYVDVDNFGGIPEKKTADLKTSIADTR